MITKMIKPINLIMISALLSVITPASSYAEGLGRLFTTPKERALLEKLRAPKLTVPSLDPIVVQEEPEPKDSGFGKEVVIIPRPDTPKITVNGFVKRSSGRSTAWVNGINTNDGYFESQHIKVNPHRVGRDHVHIEADDVTIGDVSLKVGQTLDPKAAKITDSYQNMLGQADK